MFSERLKELRKDMHLTQKELAEKLGLSPGAIGLYEQNRRTPDIDLLNKIASIFDVSIDYLTGKTERKDTAIITIEELPQELRQLGVKYIEVDKKLKEKGLTPEKTLEIIEALDKAGLLDNYKKK